MLQLYYALWQWGAYRKSRELHRCHRFDVVQHVTFGVFRHVSFMGRLGIRFILGPIGGGERVPLRLRMDYGIRGHLLDTVRDVANVLARMNPWLHEAFAAAELILAKTPDTAAAVPSRYRQKVRCVVEIGVDETLSDLPPARRNGGFRALFAGRFVFWKGMQYGLRAFAELLRDVPHARLTMVGSGPDERALRALCDSLGIGHSVEWIGWVRQAELGALYASHDVFLFPSLHDSSGTVILEAMSHGMPVVCFDLGGPGVLVNDTCGIVVPTAGRRRKELISELADAMKTMIEQPEKFCELRKGALARAREFTWAAAVDRVYGSRGLLWQQNDPSCLTAQESSFR